MNSTLEQTNMPMMRLSFQGVEEAAEGNGHDARDVGADEHDRAPVVDLGEAGLQRRSGAGVETRNHEEEDGGKRPRMQRLI
jgi:hypothetical protein